MASRTAEVPAASPRDRSSRLRPPWRRALFAAALGAALAGCASRAAAPLASLPRGELVGDASWYGRPYHGRPTASGETYDMEALTAAHRTLPFGSLVRVERRDNGRRVEVRINDRGPFVAGRVIDLSRGAARRLGMLRDGVAPVRLAPLEVPPDPGVRWIVLVGGFDAEGAARRLARRMTRGGRWARVIAGWHGDPRRFHIQIKGIRSEDAAWGLAGRMRREGHSAFVVRSR